MTTSRRNRSDPQRVEEGVSTFYILTVELDKVLLIIGSLFVEERRRVDTYDRWFSLRMFCLFISLRIAECHQGISDEFV